MIVPVYNGSEYLRECVEDLRAHFRHGGTPYELIIAEDGSTDGSKALCKQLQAEYPDLRLIQDERRLGRGASLRRAIQETKGDVVVYTDVDMATDLTCMDHLIHQAANGADIVTGSRYLPDSRVERSLPRLVSSIVYNNLVQRLLDSRITDHQCGFKAFKREVALDLLPQVKSTHWFWDTEILVRAQRSGYRVSEIAIRWQEAKYGRSTVRLASDAAHFFSEILRLRAELESG